MSNTYSNYSTLDITGYSNPSISLLSNQRFIPFNSSIYDKSFSCIYQYQDKVKFTEKSEQSEKSKESEQSDLNKSK